MCGICGFVAEKPQSDLNLADTIRRMAGSIAHRGPDSDGFYCTDTAALGFRRLSIIDLSTGDQPIPNETGSVQVVFNGEIYNFQDLREGLESRGHVFRTHSDTETIVHAYEEYGERCVEYFRGMFAFAIWDNDRQRLFIARDRLGKKPLYYYHKPGQFIAFASELKALLQIPDIPRQIAPEAVESYLTWGYIPAPGSILSGVNKLPPAHWLMFNPASHQLRVERYWSLDYLPKSTASYEDSMAELRHIVSEAVRLRMISDVPLGALLSGGVDSSVVVSQMARHSSLPVKTFSIGFDEDQFNELPVARQVAQKYGTDHHELIVRPRTAEILPDLVWYLDEPMADVSVLPTYYVAQMARQHVTVVLNGDGGDEAFAGYNWHKAVLAYQQYQTLPGWVRQGLIEPALQLVGQTSALSANPFARAQRLVEQSKQSLDNQYLRWMMLWEPPDRQPLYSSGFAQRLRDDAAKGVVTDGYHHLGTLDRMLYSDTMDYLPGDLLVKMDRMSMANSLEARSPLLDHEVVTFAAHLPEDFKRRGRIGKRILKEAFRDDLPTGLTTLPKRGFGIPVDRWLRGELKSVAADLILGPSMRQRGMFDGQHIRQMWDQHQQGTADYGPHLWSLMVLELWMQKYIDGSTPSNEA